MSGTALGTTAAGAYALRLGDDALVLAQRMGEWIASAPQLEEDVALANIGLDLLGQARALLSYAGELLPGPDGRVRTEDDLAYLRDEREWTNVQLVELADDGDFGRCIARLLVFSAWQRELYAALTASTDPTLAAVAAKAVKEVDYHRDHASRWTLRLGDGTAESHARMQAALEAVWPYVEELFEADELVDELVAAGVAADPATLRGPVLAYLDGVLRQATLVLPQTPERHTGGRRGDPHRAAGLPARRAPARRPLSPGGDVVTATDTPAPTLAELRALVAAVPDPEVPVLTIDDLGVLRGVETDADGRVAVTITPTYSGCPAMDAIADDIRDRLAAVGHPDAEVRRVLSPAWTTDWMSDAGRRKLLAYGIAPPTGRGPAGAGGGPVPLTLSVRCPQCGSPDTVELSRFGSTACKALWQCQACREPFDRFKDH